MAVSLAAIGARAQATHFGREPSSGVSRPLRIQKDVVESHLGTNPSVSRTCCPGGQCANQAHKRGGEPREACDSIMMQRVDKCRVQGISVEGAPSRQSCAAHQGSGEPPSVTSWPTSYLD